MAPKVLVVEDNRDIRELLQLHLHDIHCEAEAAASGSEALEKFRTGEYALVVLDLMLPDMDGITVCQKLRARSNYVPILMLTARSSELDRVLGLEMGADDYLTKPFSIPELMARIKALLRRVEALAGLQSQKAGGEVITRGELVIEAGKRQVRLGDTEVTLTAKEFDLLHHFARHPGRVYTRAQLLNEVWGYHHTGYEHTVNSHINRLRAKIEEDPANPRFILTVWGVGYRFADSRDHKPSLSGKGRNGRADRRC